MGRGGGERKGGREERERGREGEREGKREAERDREKDSKFLCIETYSVEKDQDPMVPSERKILCLTGYGHCSLAKRNKLRET